MKNFCRDLKKHATKIISIKKEMIPLTVEENQFYHEKIFAIYVKKQFNIYDKKYCKVRDHHHYTGKYRCLQSKIQNTTKIRAVFHNGSKYNYHFIIKELAKEFEGRFKCLGENIEKV